jgi:hypothetical protein
MRRIRRSLVKKESSWACLLGILLCPALLAQSTAPGAARKTPVITPREPAANGKPEAAGSAQGFVDTIGVNTHINYFDRLYGNFDLVRQRLQESGIRHVRDGGVIQNEGYNRMVYGRWHQLAAFGVKFDMVLDPRGSIKTPTPENLSQLIGLAGGAVESFEGPNELDDSKKPHWIDLTQSYQKELFEAKNQVPAAKAITLIGPSMAFVKNAVRVGDMSAYITYGNLHPYPAGGMPSSVFPKQIQQAQAMYGNKKLVITETGYHNATNDQRSQPSISEAAGAKYIPRLYFVDYNWGIVRTYLYEFLDEGNDPDDQNHEFHWGLVRYNGTPKPAFTALSNVIHLLGEPGGGGAAGKAAPLPLNLGGETQNVQHTLLRKADGRYYLALWQEIPSYDTKTHQDIHNPSHKVTVSTGRTFRQINLYDPLRGTTAVQHWNHTNTVTLEVPDSVVILEMAG